jgi:hypothetical protein
MALTSPGVQVTVVDESFYTPAAPGTVPLLVVATQENKTNAAGTGTATATLASNFGNVYKVTSQKELVDLFGVPFFEKTASSTPIHGSELNEYGLLAAYSLLGVSNAAFIVRANVDLAQLEGQAEAPGANPNDGSWWVNTRSTTWGIHEWNASPATVVGGQRFTSKTPIVLTDDDSDKFGTSDPWTPKGAVGTLGDYAIVFSASNASIRLWYKSAGNGGIAGGGTAVTAGDWTLVGSNAWKASHATIKGTTGTYAQADTFTINGTSVVTASAGGATVADLAVYINGLGIQGVTARAVEGNLWLYSDGNTSQNDGSIVIGTGSTELGIDAATFNCPQLEQVPHTDIPEWKTADEDRPTGSVWVKTTEPNNGARWRASKYSVGTQSWVAYDAPIYATTDDALYYLDRSGGGEGIPLDALFVQTNSDERSGSDTTPETAKFRIWRRASTGATAIVSKPFGNVSLAGGNYEISISESVVGTQGMSSYVEIPVTLGGTSVSSDADAIAAAINASGLSHIEASVDGTTYEITISHKAGGDFRIFDNTGLIVQTLFPYYNVSTGVGTTNFYGVAAGVTDDSTYSGGVGLATSWEPIEASDYYFASGDDPQNDPLDGTLWYNPEFSEVDIMIHNGTTWVGYRSDGTDSGTTASPYATAHSDSDELGYIPIVAASNPYVSGVTQTGDIWVSTADIENFPIIYKYDANLPGVAVPSERWVEIDITDQVTDEGILFADARYGTSGATGDTAGDLTELAGKDYLDPDAPDPALYPKGMLLWNLRRSGGNVKRFVNDYIDTTNDNVRFKDEAMTSYATDRWITASPNREDGAGSFGRHAQRSVVIQAMKSVIDTNDQIRDEERRNFNLIAAPGYTEAMSNLVNLNIDRGLTAFVIGDTPFRLPADATSLVRWGTNEALVFDNGDDGIVTYDEYLATFYPNGFTTDLGGANAAVPASHMMLRTIALSDNVSYPWFAPAGTRRGGITNATAVGYIDSLSGEFQTVALNEGQRDTLYDLKVNPITFFNGVGLVNYGQKTRGKNASALDRINVARLVVYLRGQLNRLARPYIFEPNDKNTRDEIKQAVESLLLELVGLRALYDFAVVCDESNNTPSRIDRNELYVDIAIEPVKAVEFIYIPLRVKNTGEI